MVALTRAKATRATVATDPERTRKRLWCKPPGVQIPPSPQMRAGGLARGYRPSAFVAAVLSHPGPDKFSERDLRAGSGSHGRVGHVEQQFVARGGRGLVRALRIEITRTAQASPSTHQPPPPPRRRGRRPIGSVAAALTRYAGPLPLPPPLSASRRPPLRRPPLWRSPLPLPPPGAAW